MSNKQRLQVNNTNLSDILLEIGDLPLKALVEAAAREGQYVWKRKNLVNSTVSNPSIVLNGPTTAATVTSSSVNLSLVDESFFGGFSYPAAPTTFYFEYTNGTLYYVSSGRKHACTYDPETCTIYSPTATNEGTHSNVTFTYSGNKAVPVPSDDNVMYVVSDDQTAYPDGGRKGDYWYERVVEGVDLLGLYGYTKIAIDEFMFSADTDAVKNNGVPHSLGETPKFAMIWTKDIVSGSHYPEYTYGWDLRLGGGYLAGVNWNLDRSYDLELRAEPLSTEGTDSTKVYLNNGCFKAGVKYTLITMA